MDVKSKMLEECKSAPAMVANQLNMDERIFVDLAQALIEQSPRAITTIARGSWIMRRIT